MSARPILGAAESAHHALMDDEPKEYTPAELPPELADVLELSTCAREVLAAALPAYDARLRAEWEAELSPAVADVLAERARQDAKWGEQNHDPFTYLAVLTEEVGELSQAALHDRFGGPAAKGLRKEAVQVAAVALAIIECLDREKWRWPK